jgi:hypothetical protein
MGYLSRQVGGGFVAGNKLFASQLNAELDHLIGAFVGTDSRNIKLKYNAGDEPTLELWNSGGNPLEIRIGEGEDLRVHVDSVGTIISAVATGTAAPITVASTAVCTNLNADFIDGHELAALIQADKAAQIISAATPVELRLQATGGGEDGGVAYLSLDTRDTDENPDSFWRLVSNGDDSFRLQQYDDSETAWVQAIQANVLADPGYFKVFDERTQALQQVATTKSRTLAQIGAYYEGAIGTGSKQPTFIVGDDSDTLVFTHAKYIYRGGTPDADTLIDIKRYGDDDALDQTYELTIPEGDSVDVVYTVDITDIPMDPDGSLTWTCTQTGDHEDLSIWLIGYQEIKTD